MGKSSSNIVRGMLWTTLANVAGTVYGFAAVPLLIQCFGKAQYGLIGLAMSVNVYIQLMDLGFNSTNVRFFSEWMQKGDTDKLRRGFSTSLGFYGIVGLLNAAVLLVIAAFGGSMFKVDAAQLPVLRELMYILAGCAVFNWISSNFDQLIKAGEDIEWIQKRILLSKVLQIAVLVLTITLHLPLTLYFALTCLSTLLPAVLSIGKIRREWSFVSFVPHIDGEIFRQILPYSLGIFVFSFFQFSFYNLRPVFLGIRGSLESVADYRVLNGIASVVTLLCGSFMGVLLPACSKAVARDDSEAFDRVAYDGTKYISAVLCFCCFGLMSVAPELLTLYVGRDYLGLVPWLCIWLLCLLGSHNQAISSLILAGNDVRALAWSSAAAAVTGLAISWVMIPARGIGGVMFGFIAYILIQTLFYYFYYWPVKMKINSGRVFLRSFLPCVLAGICGYSASSLVPSLNSVWGDFLTEGAVFALVYAGLSLLIFDRRQKDFVLSSFK